MVARLFHIKKMSMKRIFIKLSLSVFICICIMNNCYAATYYDCYRNGIYYNLDRENKTATIIGITNYDAAGNVRTTVSVPEVLTIENSPGDWFDHSTTTYSITSISSGRYYDSASRLISIEIPASITTIDISVFDLFTSLETINVNEKNMIYSSQDGILFNDKKSILIRCPKGKQGICIIPTSVKEIKNNAFDECSKLTFVAISESVTSIGDYTFYNCNSLTSVSIPDDVTSIGNYAFSGCNNLSSISIPQGVMNIGSYTFANCSDLTSITIPNSVPEVAEGTFFGCI